MDIKDFFSGMFSNKPKNVLQTPYGNFNLAKGKDIKRVQKMVIDLQRTTDALTRKDIKNWRDAWQYAINVDSPPAPVRHLPGRGNRPSPLRVCGAAQRFCHGTFFQNRGYERG